jgi:nicotinate-nucleotide adenylyltransferase
MRLGIFGGSFNPIHHGHLIVATCVAEALRLDRVLFIPTALSPLKNTRDLAPPRDRWSMVRAAIRGNPLFAASDLEIRRGGTSYTVDTLRALRKSHPGDLYLIVGADAARLLPQWRSIDEVKRLATFAVVARPGLPVAALRAKAGHRSAPKMPKQHIVEAPLLEISSTDIRERVRRGLSIRYLVPDSVERIIRKKGLYR